MKTNKSWTTTKVYVKKKKPHRKQLEIFYFSISKTNSGMKSRHYFLLKKFIIKCLQGRFSVL